MSRAFRPRQHGKTAGFAGCFHAGAGCGCHWSVRRTPANDEVLDAFLISTGLVSIAEIGDKTMLLAIMLAAAWRRPLPILLGILVATLANHAVAALAGSVLARFMDGEWVRWGVGLAFLGFAVWALIPDRFHEAPDRTAKTPARIFWATVVAFFLIEMGDKTQIATVMLAAKYNAYLWVVAGTTLGMMLANAPVVWLGERITRKVPIRAVHLVSAAIFLVLGLLAIFSSAG